MTDPLVVLVLVAATDVADPTTSAMTAATRKALDADAIVLTAEGDHPSDADALTMGERVHASHVAVIAWQDAEHASVVVHLHRAEGWFDRRYAFGADDASAERGRTIGLILASLVSGDDPGERAPAPTPPPPPAPPPLPAPTPTVVVAPPRPRRQRWAIDLGANGALASDATGLGPALAVRRDLGDWIALRVAGAARFGHPTAGRTTQLVFATGASARVFARGSFACGARVDVLLEDARVSRSSITRSRWIGGSDLVAEAALGLTSAVAIVADVGGEAMFGRTPIRVGMSQKGDLPPLRAIADLGVRVRF